MGVDVNLYAVGDITDEQIAAAEEYIRPRVTWDAYTELCRCEYTEDARVELSTLDRYYGPGYERGNWPTIYGLIRVMQAAFPHCTVYYGGDTSDDGQECTAAYLEEIWQHFLGPSGDAYREFMRAAIHA